MAEALDPAIPDDIERLAQAVLWAACDRELLLATAEGARVASRARVAVSITGFAEAAPDGPAGLAHFACAGRDGPTCHRLERFGDIGRAEVRLAALRVGLQLFRGALRALAKAA